MVVFVVRDGVAVQRPSLRPSRAVLDALSAIADGRAPGDIGLWRVKRRGLADRQGRMTAEGLLVLNHYRGT